MKLVGNHAQADDKRILDAQGNPITAGKITPLPRADNKFAHDPARPTEHDFHRFAAWRRTKCMPRNYAIPLERIEDVNQATHEFVGEVAELGELVILLGADLLLTDVGRAKLIDEIGDVFFCGMWVLDAWDLNPFLLDGAPGVDDFTPEEGLEQAHVICDRLLVAADHPLNGDEKASVEEALKGLALQMTVLSGLLCNSFKKARYQGRQQDVRQQATRVANVFMLATHVLAFIDECPSRALARNIEKLDARYPEGYVTGGGGIRKGKGA